MSKSTWTPDADQDLLFSIMMGDEISRPSPSWEKVAAVMQEMGYTFTKEAIRYVFFFLFLFIRYYYLTLSPFHLPAVAFSSSGNYPIPSLPSPFIFSSGTSPNVNSSQHFATKLWAAFEERRSGEKDPSTPSPAKKINKTPTSSQKKKKKLATPRATPSKRRKAVVDEEDLNELFDTATLAKKAKAEKEALMEMGFPFEH
jgi:hypothetical protein